jgi:predicted nucleic acid-binding protein
VRTAYLDTSALGRILLREPDAAAIMQALGGYERRVASRLMRVELRRLGLRENCLEDADRLLAGVALVPVSETLLAAAEVVAPPSVASLDAIHLVTAVHLHSAGLLDTVITYDARLAAGARAHGIEVSSPA